MNTFDINFFKENGMKITEGTFEWFPLSESREEIRMLPDEFVIDIRYNESDEVSQWKVGEAIRVLTSPWRHTKSWRPSMSNFKALEETKTYRYEKVDDVVAGELLYVKDNDDYKNGLVIGWHPHHPAIVVETDEMLGMATLEDLHRRIEVTERELFIERCEGIKKAVGDAPQVYFGMIYDELVNGKG